MPIPLAELTPDTAPPPEEAYPTYTEPYPTEGPQPAPQTAPAPAPAATGEGIPLTELTPDTGAAPPQAAAPQTYQAQPPAEQAQAPAPGGPLSGVGDVVGRVVETAGAAGGRLLAGDPGGAVETVMGAAAAPQAEYEVPRLTERAAAGRPTTTGDVVSDPSVVADILPTTSASPELGLFGVDPGSIPIVGPLAGAADKILPQGMPGDLNAPFNALGTALTTPLPFTENLAPPPTSLASSANPLLAANIVGVPFDQWIRDNPQAYQAALAEGGELGVYEAWKASGGAISTPPAELSNPIDAGKGAGNILQSATQVAGAVPEMLGGYKDALQTGNLTPFGKSTAVDITTDPLAAAQAILAGVSGGASVAAKIPFIAARPAARAVLGGVSRTAATTNRVLDVAQADPTAAAALGRQTIKGVSNLGGAVRPTQEGLSQLQGNQIIETTGSYEQARNAAAAPPPVSPARVTPGAGQTPVTPPNGRPAASPDFGQPVASGAPALVDSQGRQVSGAPAAPPPDIVSPTTGQPLHTRDTAHPVLGPHLQQLRESMRARGADDIDLLITDRILDLAPQAREFVRQGQDVPGGVFFPQERLIAIAADAALRGEAPRFLDHELVHALRTSQRFTEPEWRSLVGEAERGGFREQVRQLYGDIEQTNPEMFAEEMVAALYTAVRNDAYLVGPQTRNLIRKLMDFLKRLGGGARQTLPADVLRAIDNGEVGQRGRQAAEADALARYSRFTAPGYHGSPERNLTGLSADPNFPRNFENAATRLGAYFAPQIDDAREFITPTKWDDEYRAYRAGGGQVYRGDLDIQNAYDMTWDEFSDLDSRFSTATEGAELRRRLEDEGYGGVVVWGDEADDGTGGYPYHSMRPNDPIPQEMIDAGMIQEVASFRDVPVRPVGEPVEPEARFARRDPATEPQAMRDGLEEAGVPIRDRDPGFFDRFRAAVEGLPQEEVVRLLNEPFMDPNAPKLTEVVPDWDAQSAARMADAVAWAKGVYGDEAVETALNRARNGQGRYEGNPRSMLPPSADSYDLMLRQPMGHLLWYDISGLGFDQFGMTPEQVRLLIDLTAATSGGEVPFNNLKLAMAVYAEHAQNRPAWVPLRDEVPVEQVLQGAGFPGPKFNNFSRNIAGQTRAARAMPADLGALPTIDMWQFRSYNVTPEVGAGNPELFAIIAHHTMAEGDALQAALGQHFATIGDAPITMEHRMMQAGVWVLGRVNEGFDRPNMRVVPFAEGTDYWSVGNRIRQELADELPDLGLNGRPLQHEDFLHPQIADVLTKGGIGSYEQIPHALVGFTGRNTTAGLDAEEIWHNVRNIPLDFQREVAITKSGKNKGQPSPNQPPTMERIVSDFLNGFGTRKAEQNAGAGATVPGVAKIAQGYFDSLMSGADNVVDRLAAAITGIPDFQISRINNYAWDAASGTMTPTMDIPLNGRKGGTGRLINLDQFQADRLVYGLAQIGMLDEAAWRSWRLVPDGGNSWVIQLPQTHLESAGKGGRKVLPDEIKRLENLGAGIGGRAQVVASPRATLVKLIDERSVPDAYGDQEIPPGMAGEAVPTQITDPETLREELARAGYTESDTVFVTQAVQASGHATPDSEVGYAGYIKRPRGAEGALGAGITDPRYPDAGSLVEANWNVGSRIAYRDALVAGRGLFDAAQQRLADALPWHRARVADALAAAGREWDVPPGLTERRSALEPLGGRAGHFPIEEDALFARRPRSASDSLTALGHIAGHQRERMLANTDPNARLGYHNYVLDPTTDALLRRPLDVHWRDGSRARGAEFGDLIEQTSEKLERFIQLERDPALAASVPAEHERLRKVFVPDDTNNPVNFAALGGPGDVGKQQWLKSRITGEAIADAVERGLPKTAKGSMGPLMDQMGGALDEFTRVRSSFGLFAVWNVPKYFSQNWVGNGIMTGLKTPGALPAYLERLGHVRRTAKEVSGKSHSTYDARLRRMGVSAIPTVDLVDKAAIGGRRGDVLPQPTSALGRAARLFMSEKATAWAQTGDYAQRQAVAETVIDDGYAVLNRNLPRITFENIRKAPGSRTPLPYTERQIRTAVDEFLQSKRTMTDLNTDEVYKDRLGRVAKFEPVYSAEEFRDAMRSKLLAVNNRVDTTVLNDALHRMWADVELAKRSTIDRVKREVEDVAYSWVPTNVSQGMSKVVMYPYWTTKAGVAYARYMLSHPAAAGAYGRMMQDLEERSEELGMPEWMKTFFRVMNTPMGMEVWYSPTDLLATFFTFPDWAMESGSNDWDDLTGLGKKASDIPFLLNPLLSLGIYASGAGGPDYKPPDVLGVNRGTTLASSLLNMANAHGLLPEWIGKDGNGEIVPISPKPVEELVGRVGHVLSSALQSVTGLEPVPVPNAGATQASDVTYWLEQNARVNHPNLGQEDINALVTRAMADHESPEYREALAQMASQALTLGGGLDLPLTPEGFDRALEAVLRISSPVGITAGPEQRFLESRAKGMTPSGEIPPRDIPHLGEVGPDGLPTPEAEEAQRLADASKYGANKTLASRAFNEEISGYYDGLNADGLSQVAGNFHAIYQSRDEESGAKEDRLPSEPVTVGGLTYSPEEIGAMDYGTRKLLANAYAAEHGTSTDQIYARGDAQDVFREEYYAAHPLVGSYITQFRDPAKDFPGGELAYVGALMGQNPAYAQYVFDNAIKDGNVDPGAALSSDAFLASQGIAPSNYTPLVSPPLSGPGRQPPPPTPIQPNATPMETLSLRAGPGTQYASQMTLNPGVPLKTGAAQGDWTQVSVPGQEIEGWVATGYLGTMDGATNGVSPNGVSPNGSAPPASGWDALGGGVGSLVDAAGAVVGTMAGALGFASKPAETSVGKPYGAFDVVPANDGMGVQSTEAGSDRTWMENMIGPSHAKVTTDYKGPAPVGVDYSYQGGHGAATTNHAAYDISCDDPGGNCVGTPMYAPMGGKVVCSGYGDGTGEAVGSPACTYSQNTTLPGQAHTIVIEVGRDRNGNPIQLSFNHMGTSTLKAGQTVKAGDMIGTMGNTNGGPHVHLEGWLGDAGAGYLIVDPQLVVGGYYFGSQPSAAPVAVPAAAPAGGVGAPTLDWLGGLTGRYDAATPSAPTTPTAQGYQSPAAPADTMGTVANPGDHYGDPAVAGGDWSVLDQFNAAYPAASQQVAQETGVAVPTDLIKAMNAMESGYGKINPPTGVRNDVRGKPLAGFVGVFKDAADSWGADFERMTTDPVYAIYGMTLGLSRIAGWDATQYGAPSGTVLDNYGWDGVMAIYYSGQPHLDAPQPADDTTTVREYVENINVMRAQVR